MSGFYAYSFIQQDIQAAALEPGVEVPPRTPGREIPGQRPGGARSGVAAEKEAWELRGVARGRAHRRISRAPSGEPREEGMGRKKGPTEADGCKEASQTKGRTGSLARGAEWGQRCGQVSGDGK